MRLLPGAVRITRGPKNPSTSQRLGRRRERISERDLERVAGLSVRAAAQQLGVPVSRVHRERRRVFQKPPEPASGFSPETMP